MEESLDRSLKITRICSWNVPLSQFSAIINEFGKLRITTKEFDLISQNIVSPIDSADIIYKINKSSFTACEILTSNGSEMVFDYKSLTHIEN